MRERSQPKRPDLEAVGVGTHEELPCKHSPSSMHLHFAPSLCRCSPGPAPTAVSDGVGITLRQVWHGQEEARI